MLRNRHQNRFLSPSYSMMFHSIARSQESIFLRWYQNYRHLAACYSQSRCKTDAQDNMSCPAEKSNSEQCCKHCSELQLMSRLSSSYYRKFLGFDCVAAL